MVYCKRFADAFKQSGRLYIKSVVPWQPCIEKETIPLLWLEIS
jgi:hypothetical protein